MDAIRSKMCFSVLPLLTESPHKVVLVCLDLKLTRPLGMRTVCVIGDVHITQDYVDRPCSGPYIVQLINQLINQSSN